MKDKLAALERRWEGLRMTDASDGHTAAAPVTPAPRR